MEDEKSIVFNSSVQDINITNRLAHFQNSLFSKNYLDSNKKYAITPHQIYIDLNFNKTEDPSVPAAGIGYLNGSTQMLSEEARGPKRPGPKKLSKAEQS